mgnify:CR=1 FL=1
MSTITTNHLRLQYGERVIAEDLTIAFDKPEIVSIIGPNGSGKSTLLKSLARLLVRRAAPYIWTGRISKTYRWIRLPGRFHAAPVGQRTGRYDCAGSGDLRPPAYQGLFSKLNDLDIAAINSALKATEMEPLQHSRLSALSGGERQRAWLSMALAKEPAVSCFSTNRRHIWTIRHQLALMELVVHLYQTMHIIVIMSCMT